MAKHSRSDECVPRAIRRLNSRVLWDMLCDVTPYNPISPTSGAIPLNITAACGVALGLSHMENLLSHGDHFSWREVRISVFRLSSERRSGGSGRQ